MKIINEDITVDDVKWSDDAEKMLRYYTNGSIDDHLGDETHHMYNKYDMQTWQINLKHAKNNAMRDWGGDRKDNPKVLAQVKKNKELYDDLVYFLDDAEYQRLKAMFIDKYDTPVPGFNIKTGELNDNGASHRANLKALLNKGLTKELEFNRNKAAEVRKQLPNANESLDEAHDELSHLNTKAYTAKDLGIALLSLKGDAINYPVYVNDSEWGDEEVNNFFVDEDEKRVYIN